MELNPAYNCVPEYEFVDQNSHDLAESNYEEIELDLQTTETTTSERKKIQHSADGKTQTNIEIQVKGKNSAIIIVLAIAIVAAVVLAVIVVIVLIARTNNFNQEIQSLQLEVGNLREMLNQTGDNSNQEIQTLQLEIQRLQTILSSVPRGTIEFPASSCGDIPQDSPSGEYWIQTNNPNSPVQVYCDVTRTCCNTTGGWTRVANLDMTDPNQQCPDGFRLVNRTTAPQRTCGRPDNFTGCLSTTFPVHGIEYSQVCGRVIGYQDQTPDAFAPYWGNSALTIDDSYVDGISLTHGQLPRQHIWTFAAAVDEFRAQNWVCPCTRPDLTYTGAVPPFIGQDYFCETGSRNAVSLNIFYSDDPLWNGQGCGGTSTCCSFNNPPWFCKQLPQPTTDDIELRLCGDFNNMDEDTPIEIVEIYIK